MDLQLWKHNWHLVVMQFSSFIQAETEQIYTINIKHILILYKSVVTGLPAVEPWIPYKIKYLFIVLPLLGIYVHFNQPMQPVHTISNDKQWSTLCITI